MSSNLKNSSLSLEFPNPEETNELVFKWEKIKSELKNDFKSIIWNSWIGPLQFLSYQNDVITILASSELVKSRIEHQYYEQIFLRCRNNFSNLNKIKFVINDETERNKKSRNNNIQKVENNSHENSLSFVTSVSKSLNKEYNFNNFVTDESNELAFLSSKKVSQSFSSIYNPLYIYGGVGLGKTHLLNSIAWEMKNKSKRKFVYMSAERFMYQFIKSIKLKETLKFKEQFRSIDVLMIDDLQFMSGKESTQEEFIHLFNDLIDLKKQIIITADKSPGKLKELDYRITSRLSGGLVVDILPTNYNLRIKIIKNKLVAKKAYLDSEIIKFLAKKVTSSVRELEGAINKLIAYSDLMSFKLEISNAKEILSDLFKESPRKLSINDIQSQVSKHFNINFSDLCSKKRSRSISRPRQVAMYLCKELTEFSYPEIGKYFGGKDHATVIHGVNKIKNLSSTDKKIQRDIENLMSNLIS
tara:strand:+ start:131 stop:1543 length:1413 start_codon:yes stop_codon:yes gene_type:complete